MTERYVETLRLMTQAWPAFVKRIPSTFNIAPAVPKGVAA
jgi:hypothetical protein